MLHLRRIHLTGVAALVLVLAAAPVAVARGGHGHSHEHNHGHSPGHAHGPAQIDLPDGWQPEGITTDGKRLYAGSLADGAIYVAGPRDGDGEVLAPGAPGQIGRASCRERG